MATRRYEIYPRVLKNISRVSAANEWNIFQHKINFVSPSDLIIFFLLYKMWRFSTTFRRFSKIFKNWPECQTNFSEQFPKIYRRFRRFPKIVEDDRRSSEDASIIHRQTKCSYRVKNDHSSKNDIFTWGAIISSHVRIYCFRSPWAPEFGKKRKQNNNIKNTYLLSTTFCSSGINSAALLYSIQTT